MIIYNYLKIEIIKANLMIRLNIITINFKYISILSKISKKFKHN